ncbi:DUF2158 domain-containing protein [Acinetobacter baumannii]
MSDLTEGSVVYLKSGSPAMTISQIFEETGYAKCVFFVNGMKYEDAFKLYTLTLEKPEGV